MKILDGAKRKQKFPYSTVLCNNDYKTPYHVEKSCPMKLDKSKCLPEVRKSYESLLQSTNFNFMRSVAKKVVCMPDTRFRQSILSRMIRQITDVLQSPVIES